MGRSRFINDTLSAAFGLQRTSLGDGNIARNRWLDSHLPGGRLASVSGLSCKWICLKNERNERQREEWEIELIAAGHGDNDSFMDPVRVKWPRRLVGLVFFFEREWTWGWTSQPTGAFIRHVNAFGFMTRSTCQQRFQMTHFVFTQCKFAATSLHHVDGVRHPYVEQGNV